MMTQRRNRRSGVEDRWTKTVRDEAGNTKSVPSAANGQGLRWRARYVDDDNREHAKGFRTKTEAQQWLASIVSAQVTGTYVDPELGKITFASFYKEWSTRQVWVSGTRHVMDQAVRSVTFGKVALTSLRPSHLETWVKGMQEDGLEPSTIKTRFSNARTVLRAAVRDRYMPRDITTGIKLPRQRKLAASMTIPDAAQIGGMLRAAEDDDGWFVAYIAVCAFAGLRRGEACALQVGDIGWLRKELEVSRQVQWTDDGRMEIRGPKYGSERTVFVPDGLLTILSEHVRLYRQGDDPERWLFPGYLDPKTPAHSARVNRAWRSARAKVGIEHVLHDCRHFYASGLIAAGCDVVTVQRALGHASAAMTLTTYSHLWPNASDRTRKAAAGLVDQALNPAADALRTEGSKSASD
jgi:integrase